MKKFNLFLLIMLISTVLFAQKLAVTEVPAQVTTDLKTRFPAAEKAIWEKDNTIIKVSFINEGNKMEIAYLNNNVLHTKWLMGTDYVPQKIKDYVVQFYAGNKIIALSFLDKSSGERVYEVVIAKKKKETKTLVFDSSNNFLRIEEEIKKTN